MRRKQPKNQPKLPEAARARLVERLRERFKLRGDHPPLKLFFGATEQEQRIGREIDRCFPPFEGWEDDPALPKQVQIMKAYIEERERRYRLSVGESPWMDDDDSGHDDWGHSPHFYKSEEDWALGELLASDHKLEPETRAYIIRRYLTKSIYLGDMIDRDRKNAEFAETIKRVKRLLRQSGRTADEADQDIAEDLGIPVPTLRQRLTRAPK